MDAKDQMKQMDKKVAFLLADDFEDSEMQSPFEAVTKNGHEAVIISKRKHADLKGKKGIVFTSHISSAEAMPANYEMIVIPGGKSPSTLCEDEEMVRFVREADQSGVPIAAICHGPELLVAANVVKDRTLTSHQGVADEIQQAGGTFIDREVVVDRNFITSRKPEDEPYFNSEIIKKLGVAAY